MNEICEFDLWSLPWHDLQRSLASRLDTALNLQSVAASANSWLSRAAYHAPRPAALAGVLPPSRLRPGAGRLPPADS
jgi:hypothetical protein